MPKKGTLLSLFSLLIFLSCINIAFNQTVSVVDWTKPIAYGKSKFIGCTILHNYLSPNWDRYWNQVTPEYLGKWSQTQPNKDQMNWSGLDFAYNYAKQQGILFKGHTFAWGQQVPWWVGGLSATQQAAQVQEWIKLYCQRYPDYHLIDVVNQPLHQTPVYANAIKGSNSTGWDWVIWVYQKARMHCPNAKLLINQYDVLNTPSNVPRYLTIINLLKDRGLIDGIGEQGHHLQTTDNNMILQGLNSLAATGLPLYISELDLNIWDDTAQLNRLKSVFPLLYQHPSVKGVTFWGYTKGQQWLGGAWLYDASASGSSSTTSSSCPITSVLSNQALSFTFQDFSVTLTKPGIVRARFANDGTVNSQTMQVDYAIIDGVKYEAQSQAVNTAVWQNKCGGSYSQLMHCPGYIEFTVKATSSVTIRARAVDKGGQKLTIQIVQDCNSTSSTNNVAGLAQQRASLKWLKYEYFYQNATTTTNVPPTANFIFTVTNLVAKFDGSLSTDSDGYIYSYQWNFGDSTPKVTAQAKPSHTYTNPGTYTVTLTVADNKGATNVKTLTVSVTNPPTNILPIARFTFLASYLSVSFDASTSSDADGSILSYSWNLGNGVTQSTSKFVYTYPSAGTYTVTLTVTDNSQGQNTASQIVQIVNAPVNNPPTARFVISTINGLTVNVDASSTTDDGTITQYSWNFGDGNVKSSSVSTSSNTYINAGTYTINLTVTDNNGQTNSVTQIITVQKSNVPPKASFVAVINNLVVNFDASASTDSDGNIIDYSWNYGDGLSGNGKIMSHTYANPGSYPVVLTVKDNQNAVNSFTQTITLVQPTLTCTINCNINFLTVGCVGNNNDATVNSYDWKMGNGQILSGSKNINYNYQNPGTYSISLTVKNPTGNTATCQTGVTVASAVSNNLPPIARYTEWVEGKILHVYFGGYDPDGDQIVSYQWNFGDATPILTGQTQPVHTYLKAGKYNVSIKVTDSRGASSTFSKILAISPAINCHVQSMTKYTIGTQTTVFAVSDVLILDNNGDPAPNVRVEAFIQSPQSSLWQNVAGTTDLNGKVSLKATGGRSPPLNFEICVNNLVSSSLYYQSGDNKIRCLYQ